jgi:hypothetical protein
VSFAQADIHLQQVARLVEEAEAADALSAASLYRRIAELLDYIQQERMPYEQTLPEREEVDHDG